jgi:SAM-dependent methyltransferase
MSLFYRLAYSVGFTPWERAASHPPAAKQIAALFDREAREVDGPGHALDLGCGTGYWSVELARRGWRVTGIDIVRKAVRRARQRARDANVDVKFLEGDITALRAAGIGGEFQLIWDFGTVHGLTPAQREAVGREVSAVARPDATLLMLAWAPGRRGPLPRGANHADIEAAFAGWTIAEVEPFDVTGLPPPLRNVVPQMYRLRRA